MPRKKSENQKYLYSLSPSGKRTRKLNPNWQPKSATDQTNQLPLNQNHNENLGNTASTPQEIVALVSGVEVPVKPETRAEKEYRVLLETTLGVASLLVFVLICLLASMPLSLAEQLSMTPDEVSEFAEHGSKLLDKAGLSDKAKKTILAFGEWGGLIFASLTYGARVVETVDSYQKGHVVESRNSTGAVPTPQQPGANGYSSQFDPASVAGFGSFTTAS
jgi:hypothetical protein